MLRRVVLALCLIATPTRAQAPARDLPNGKELVVVYVGAKTCAPCLLPATKAAVAQVKQTLAATAKRHGYAFSSVGVSLDWSTDDGLEFLRGNGPFDQLVVGGNWTNLAAEHFIWRDAATEPAIPQIIVLERTVTQQARLTFSSPRVLHRVMGGDEIPTWARAGAPVAIGGKAATSRR